MEEEAELAEMQLRETALAGGVMTATHEID